MKKVGIIGATGYGGVELVRLLLDHPAVELCKLSSVSFEGKKISDVYPTLYTICDDTLRGQDEVVNSCDIIFAALPHGLSQPLAKQCDEKGILFIDLGADFRLDDEDVYKKWYGCEFEDKELQAKSVYGLCEFNREQIKKTNIIANPGCYPTSIALGLYPALKNKMCKTTGIIIDSKSGATGAGRSLTQNTHFTELNEGFAPYKVGKHRHTPEIEQTLSKMSGEDVKVTFVPHLLPINRGIESTIYVDKNGDYTLQELRDLYVKFYKDEKFVTVLPLGSAVNLRNVRMTNQCQISLHEDEHTGKIIIASVIDNMVKGAAGQAIQNMNIALGIDEDTALPILAPAF